MVWEGVPYTNYHDLNTDWLVSKVSDVEKARDEAVEAAAEAASYTGISSVVIQTRGNSATSIVTKPIPDGIYFILEFAYGGSITGELFNLYYTEVYNGGAVVRPMINDDVIDAGITINANNITVINNYPSSSEQVRLMALGATGG